MVLAADYPFMDVLLDDDLFFSWVVWIWMMILILSDVSAATTSAAGRRPPGSSS